MSKPSKRPRRILSDALSVLLTGEHCRRASQYQMKGEPDADGDCMFMPPAALLDMPKNKAMLWRLVVGTIQHDSMVPFRHCWLWYKPMKDQLPDYVVSISNVINRKRTPFICSRERYYRANNIDEVVVLDQRELKIIFRCANDPATLAKFLMTTAKGEFNV